MNATLAVWHAKARITKNILQNAHNESKLKISVVAVFGLGLWLAMFAASYKGLDFINDFGSIGRLVVVEILSLLSLASFFMLIFSNILIGFSTMYTSEESSFLMGMPISYGGLYASRFVECVTFSSWAVVFLGSPFILSYGAVLGAPWQFYVTAVIYAGPFILIPALIGNSIAVALTRIFPKMKMRTLALAIMAVTGLFFVYMRQRFDVGRITDERLLAMMLDMMAGTQSPFLPSFWAANGLLAAAQGSWRETLYSFGLLLSTALMLWVTTLWIVERLYFQGYSLLKSAAHRGGISGHGPLGRIDRMFSFLPIRLRSLVVKDIRMFWRDIGQWSQFLLFFGLMALYVANIRASASYLDVAVWRAAVSWLNFAAAALILATLTTRFVFPLLSLEGRRFWIIGLAPVSVRFIIWQKFFLSCTTSMLFTLTVIVLSNIRLEVSGFMMALTCSSMVMMNFALNGLAIGLGATYPNFREDNPARIVSGMGGTLTFVLSIAYLLVTVMPQAVVIQLRAAGFIPNDTHFVYAITAALILLVVSSIVTTLVPMRIGQKSLETTEF